MSLRRNRNSGAGCLVSDLHARITSVAKADFPGKKIRVVDELKVGTWGTASHTERVLVFFITSENVFYCALLPSEVPAVARELFINAGQSGWRAALSAAWARWFSW